MTLETQNLQFSPETPQDTAPNDAHGRYLKSFITQSSKPWYPCQDPWQVPCYPCQDLAMTLARIPGPCKIVQRLTMINHDLGKGSIVPLAKLLETSELLFSICN